MIDDDNRDINMLLVVDKNTMINRLVFTYSSMEILSMTFDEMGMEFDKWHRIEVCIDTRKALFTISVEEKSFAQNIPELNNFDKINLAFGINDQFGTQITDIDRKSVV